MPEQLADARTHIDKNQADALRSFDDDIKRTRDGIIKSFDQSRQQVLDKQNGATQHPELALDVLGQRLAHRFCMGSHPIRERGRRFRRAASAAASASSPGRW